MKAGRAIQPLIRRPLPLLPSRSLVCSPRPFSSPPLPLRSIRSYSQITPRRGPANSPGYPSDTEYADSTVYAFSYLSRIVRYVLYGVLTLGGVSLITFEGLHLYVEKVCMASPSRVGSEDQDSYGWIGENQGWTGGMKGGTDPRLGQKARHALRGAWICQEWGAGGSATSALSSKSAGSSFHPDYVAVRGMIGQNKDSQSNKGIRQMVDRGYELAEEFIDLAIREARKKGLVFPPHLSGSRSSGPPPIQQNESTHGIPQGDPAVLDLLLLKAGILERINTSDSLIHAKDIYEQVLNSMNHSQDEQHLHNQARVMRLAGKVGDLCARNGGTDEAIKWWSWGLKKADIEMSKGHNGFTEVTEEVKKESRGWFGFGSGSSSSKQTRTDTISTAPTAISAPSTSPLNLSPAILRASISLLVSASAHLATSSSLDAASSLQAQALSLIPSTIQSINPTSSSADLALHESWLQHRVALLKLHQASVLHAQNIKSTSGIPLKLVTEASTLSEEIVSSIQPLPSSYTIPRSSPLAGPAKLLRRDVLLTGAETAYTRAVFLERSLPSTPNGEEAIHQLELAAECFERAMHLNNLESGVEKKDGDELGQGEDWSRYWRGYVRVRGKINGLIESQSTKVA
ncbi:uncharacterized protein IL334_006724 [Kwoniella shivajii]|uniref:Uncharacterized protein n=1 Tax=Kwoniella shivajii TaxID=564305 RepID=A0ABZ1D7E5_9TREE|nr:hypothetical protein IL334_006724 [Kwoniella shivajii]